MKFRFIGQHTGDGIITMFGTDFIGDEPSNVTSEEGIRRLSSHPEFELVADEPAKAENPPTEKEKPVSAPKAAPKTRKPRKARK